MPYGFAILVDGWYLTVTGKTFFKLNERYRMKFLPYQLIRAKAAYIREPSRHFMVMGKVFFERISFVCRLKSL